MTGAALALGESGSVLAGVRILLNSPDTSELLNVGGAPRDAGARVETAATVQEAFDAFQADPPDVLVSDLDGPETQNYRLIRQVRGLREAGGVPAVAFSARPWEEQRSTALAAGYTQWISKPAKHAVIDVVAALLGRRRRAEAHSGGTREVGAVTSSRRASLSTSAAILTDVAVTPIAETIRRLWRERRTGDLFVRSRRVTKMVFFEEGRIVFAASNVKKERLGEALVALGVISTDAFSSGVEGNGRAQAPLRGRPRRRRRAEAGRGRRLHRALDRVDRRVALRAENGERVLRGPSVRDSWRIPPRPGYRPDCMPAFAP